MRPSPLLRIRAHWLILVVVVGFALTALVVPVMVPTGVGDDWVYVRSIEILLREGRLHILDLSVVTLVFQVVGGALFAALFGLDFGVLRLRRLAWNRASLQLAIQTVGIPGLAILGYYVWLVFFHGVPREHAAFTRSVLTAGWEQSALLSGRMTFIAAMYVGLFALPGVVRVCSSWAARLAWVLLLTAGLLHVAGLLGTQPPASP